MSQIPFDLGHRPALAREDFLVAPSNELAVAWIDRWPHWPHPLLTVHGAPGCGKTHLAEVWCHVSGARALSVDDLLEPGTVDRLVDGGALLFDDLEGAVGETPALEEPLFHLYNRLLQVGGSLLATGESPPSQWALRLPDLRSRLATGATVGLGLPDDVLMQGVLFKLFSDRQLRVPHEVLEFTVKRMERSFAAARRLVDGADRAALAARRSITIPLMRDILEESGAERSPAC